MQTLQIPSTEPLLYKQDAGEALQKIREQLRAPSPRVSTPISSRPEVTATGS